MSRPGSISNAHRFEWDRLVVTLVWNYGLERTQKILDGDDPQTNADIAAWRNIGGRSDRPK